MDGCIETDLFSICALWCWLAWLQRVAGSEHLDEGIDVNATLTVELPLDGLPTAAELPADFADEVRFLLAVKLFEQGRISSGKAGRLCNMGRVEFLLAAGRTGVPVVDLQGDDLDEEFA